MCYAVLVTVIVPASRSREAENLFGSVIVIWLHVQRTTLCLAMGNTTDSPFKRALIDGAIATFVSFFFAIVVFIYIFVTEFRCKYRGFIYNKKIFGDKLSIL
jgi:hypothetical protein